jgi:DNA-binding NtrC family response regulator
MNVPDRLPLLCVGCLSRERLAVDNAVSSLGFSTLWARSQRHAVSIVSRGHNTVLLDLTRRDALPTARAIRNQNPNVVMIGLVQDAKRDHVAAALREGVVEVASKPIVASELARAITAARRLHGPSPTSLIGGVGAVFVRSAPMQTAIDTAWRAALSDSPTLIIGEPQTGRELLARTIHGVAGHDVNSFIKIDCADLKPSDLEIQLFGFRVEGAQSVRPDGHLITPWSSLYRAARGTIFLKHFASMPGSSRAMLARALLLRQASVDGRRLVDLKIRVIVAAGPSAGDERACADLCGGLAFIRLHVPPLRQRREDMGLLVSHFVDQMCQANGVSPKIMTATAIAVLTALPWRGNVGELRHLLQQLVARVPGGVIRVEDLLPYLRLGFGSSTDEETLKRARSRFERDYVIAALERHGGRIGETAQALGILRPNLHRKMRGLQIVRANGPAMIAHADVQSARITDESTQGNMQRLTLQNRSLHD